MAPEPRLGRERSVITKHIRNAYREGGLDRGATSASSAQVRSQGVTTVSREVNQYNLDVIISVGYRVKSLRVTQFRIWATRTLRDHLLRGYTLNEKRLAKVPAQPVAPVTPLGLDEARSTVVALGKDLHARGEVIIHETEGGDLPVGVELERATVADSATAQMEGGA